MSLPSFVGENGICRGLGVVLGDMGGVDRWQTLLDTRYRIAIEFLTAWDALQGEAQDCCNYLGHDLEGTLAVTVAEVGQGSIDGSTTSKVTVQRDQLRKAVLSKSLQNNHDQTARVPDLCGHTFNLTSYLRLGYRYFLTRHSFTRRPQAVPSTKFKPEVIIYSFGCFRFSTSK